eukprot:103417-Pleurochrysis_carterae.AAC.1
MTDCTWEQVKRCPLSCVDKACTTRAVIAAVSMATLAVRDTMGQVLWWPSARVADKRVGASGVASATSASREGATAGVSGTLRSTRGSARGDDAPCGSVQDGDVACGSELNSDSSLQEESSSGCTGSGSGNISGGELVRAPAVPLSDGLRRVDVSALAVLRLQNVFLKAVHSPACRRVDVAVQECAIVVQRVRLAGVVAREEILFRVV